MITINGNNIYTSYGLIFQELTGILDMPKRIGTISHDWGTSIEPFLDAADIEFDGRNFELKCFGEIPDMLFSGMIELGADWGTFNVYCQDEVKHDNKQLTIPLYEPKWIQPTVTGTASGGSGFRINGFNLYSDFGIIISEVNDYKNMPKRISVDTTDYYRNAFYRDEGIMNLIGAFYGDIVTNISKFYALMSSEGMKTLLFPDNSEYQVYAADGCKINEVYPNMATFQITLRRQAQEINIPIMSELGELITAEDGQLI